MGQYHKVVNLDARAFLHPHAFGDGLKLLEFGMSAEGTLTALACLIADTEDVKGPWARQRLVVTGDYGDEGRWVPERTLYQVVEEFSNAEEAARQLVSCHLGETHPACAKQPIFSRGVTLWDSEKRYACLSELLADAQIPLVETPEELSELFSESLRHIPEFRGLYAAWVLLPPFKLDAAGKVSRFTVVRITEKQPPVELEIELPLTGAEFRTRLLGKY